MDLIGVGILLLKLSSTLVYSQTEDVDDCSAKPCRNGGTCNELETGYTCSCIEGWEGKNCETIGYKDSEEKLCSPKCSNCDLPKEVRNDCDNDDECLENGRKYCDGISTCFGIAYLKGNLNQALKTCSSMELESNGDWVSIMKLELDPCGTNPCANGGICKNKGSDFICDCSAEWDGKICDARVVDQYEPANTTILCTSSDDNSTTRKQCSSDQECRGNGRSFCDSNPECFGIAWYDKNPEQDLKVCLSFESTTNSGWHTMLKIDENDCEPNPCQNGGTCADEIFTYDCECAPGYIGTNCENKTHWLGPTCYVWSDKRCGGSLIASNEKTLGDCKLACENSKSCNAIEFKDTTVLKTSEGPCFLRNCSFPVPAPCGSNDECKRGVSEEPDNELRGYYRATALLKCADMSEVELGSTKCNSSATTDDYWWLQNSWDDAQNCLTGCISRMNQKDWDEACCEFDGGDNGGACVVYNAVDVIVGDENSKAKKAVNCKVEPVTGTSTTAKRPTTSSKEMSTTTKSLDVTATKDQMNPRTIERDDPDGGADSGSSTCKLNGKKKIFLMIHVTIAQMLLMLFVIKHKNV